MILPSPKILALVIAATCLIGCDGFDGDDGGEVGATATTTATEASSTGIAQVTSETVLVRDPVENAFTVQMPKGWRNLAYMERAYDITHEVLTSESPDGNTVIWAGDPAQPMFFKPHIPNAQFIAMNIKYNPLMKFSEYIPANQYFTDYTKRKFGKLSGFEFLGVEDDPKGREINLKRLRDSGQSIPIECVITRFRFKEKGKTMTVMVKGVTGNLEGYWVANSGGISTNGNPEDYHDMLTNISRTYKIEPSWTALQARRNEQAMEEIRRRGRENMQTLQDMANRHQIRMNAIRAQGDASMKAYYERDAASDRSHRNFLNMINEETTVAGPDGKSHQVSNAYERYYMHKRTGKYVGGDAHFDQDSLRKAGLNPDDYDEVRVKR
ncbi:MAG: hypothetical protein H7Y17_04025 [Chlorobia bacterium]|nr:hypothetical protein [Fimbriimonadaceae bacterium]